MSLTLSLQSHLFIMFPYCQEPPVISVKPVAHHQVQAGSQVIINYYQLSIIINYYQLLSFIINYYQLLLMY